MPTNQSSPWSRGNLRTCSGTERPTTATSASEHPKTVLASEVPLSQLQLSRRKDQAKPLSANVASSAPLLRQTVPAPPAVSLQENGDKNQAKTWSQFTTVPHVSPNILQLDEIQSIDQTLATGLKQAGGTEINGPTFIPDDEQHTDLNVQLTGAMQEPTSLQTRDSAAVSSFQATTEVPPLGLEPFLFVQDLFIEGQLSPQKSNNLVNEAADCSSLPLVPPLCLSDCEHQEAETETDASTFDSTNVEKRSTTGESMMAARRSHLLKPFTICTDSCVTVTALNDHLEVRGGPPEMLLAATDYRPQKINLKGSNRFARGNTMITHGKNSPPATSPVPKRSVSSDTMEKPPKLQDAITGALLGSVTSQISTIHLTRRGDSVCVPSSLTEERMCGQDPVMQVDAVEEELPVELEDACSDDDDSDCSVSSTASVFLQSGIEEPMLQGAEDDRDERPALVPSLFPFMPPTLYFSGANEKVELLPAEQRRLLKWKISTVTPNVVKHTVARSHFKVTKKSHDWLGCWGHHMKSPGFKSLGQHQKLNHFPGTFQIGRKDRLWRNLSKMQARFGKQEFSFFPRTFVLPQDIKLLRKAWEDGGSRQKWIIKPPASARGIGIQVIHKWSQMPRKRPLLVQKYLHKPYLISGNKFDLRIYVYVTSYEPLKIYIFSDGLVRFASCKYSSSMKTLGNKFMHLTNYSVNKKNSEYQTNSDDKACQGHKWALKALWQYLGSRGVNTTLIWEKIKDIVIKTVIASEPYVYTLLKINVRTPYSCHELFGFDIMLDENLKPWILEVNISPSLHSNTALDVAIKGQMVKDLLNLAGFRIPQKDDVISPCSSASSSSSSLSGGSRERTRTELSADERVKRAFYLSQRYVDKDVLQTVLDVLTPDDVRVLAESEDELSRRGQFERVFPSASSSRYLRFFECQRYHNILLDQWEQKHWSNRSKGISLLTGLCQRGVHLGTNDPAHTWSKCSYISTFASQKRDLVSPSRSRVVVSFRCRSRRSSDNSLDRDGASLCSLPISPSPECSAATSPCESPQPGLSQSPPPQL